MQKRSQKILAGIINTQRIANGYVFFGSERQIKIDAAKYFAAALNCTGKTSPCGTCESCTKAQKNVHPDIITFEKDKTSIKIEQIRSLKTVTRYGPSEGKWQAIIINDADSMTTEAANSFLKVLEEPSPNVVFILLSEREGALPKTILSRCQKIIFEESSPELPSEETMALFNKINNNEFHYIELSQTLSEAKNPKEILQHFFTLYTEAKKAKQAREVLETLKGIEKRANQKLALDLLSLKLWKTN